MKLKQKISAMILALTAILGIGLVSAPAASAADSYTYFIKAKHCATSWEYRPGYWQYTWYKRYVTWYGYVYEQYSHYEYTNYRCWTA